MFKLYDCVPTDASTRLTAYTLLPVTKFSDGYHLLSFRSTLSWLFIVTVTILGAIIASGCGGSGSKHPGRCADPEINDDSWQIECLCTDGSSSALATWNFCFDAGADPRTTLQQKIQCDRSAVDLVLRGARGTSCHVNSTAVKIGTGDCPKEVDPACETASTSMPLVGSSAQPLHGWKNSNATFVGMVDTTRSRVEITFRGETARPVVTGSAYITGGDCPGANCDIRVDSISLSLNPFVLASERIEQFKLVDWGPWSGSKLSNNTYQFDPLEAKIKVSASIGGEMGAMFGNSIGIPGGQFYDSGAPLPGGGIAPNGYMTVEGAFTLDEGEARVFLVLPFGVGRPRTDVGAKFVPCDVSETSPCGWIFDVSETGETGGESGEFMDVEMSLYQLHESGAIWRYTGRPCGGGSCPGWQQIDNNSRTELIVAGKDGLYQLHEGGAIWRYTGTPCSGGSCPGWQQIDNNSRTELIVAGKDGLYQLHEGGAIWRYTGTPCSDGSCPGWQQIDNNSRTEFIVAGKDGLYQLHEEGAIWRYTGRPCGGGSCPGWQQIDNNSRTELIVAGKDGLYQLHEGGAIWRYTGRPCGGGSCPGWQQIDNNSRTELIVTPSSD